MGFSMDQARGLPDKYELLFEQAKGILEAESWYVSALSNLSSLIMDTLPDLNWAGFYLFRNGELTVGPFQGKPACIHIAAGKGVCGTAVQENRVLRVADVHEFPGHIACDCDSRSEIVIPLRKNGRILGVLDIDSPVLGRFTSEDQIGLELFAEVLAAAL